MHGPSGLLNEASGVTPRYPLQDALGSVRARTDASGAVIGTATWDVWGNTRAASGTQSGFGWTGELRDPTTNLVYLRARDYSAGTGRFTSRDTVVPNAPGTQGYNPYAYASGNPTTFTDPSGHSAFLAGVTARFAASGLVGFSAFLVGTGPMGLSVGAAIVMVLLIIIVILLVLQLILDYQECRYYGISFGDCFNPFGGSATGTAGIDVGSTTIALAATGAATNAASCVAEIGLNQTTGAEVFSRCPVPPGGKPPRGDSEDPCGKLDDFADLVDLLQELLGAPDTRVSFPDGSSGTRLPQDVGVNPDAPDSRSEGTIAKSTVQNETVKHVVDRLTAAGAEDIRINQHQVNLNGVRVGINRPDLQFTLNGQRYYIEYDSPTSSRATAHADRIRANDPNGVVICKELG